MDTSKIANQTKSAIPPEVKLKYCLYARRSTTAEDRQVLSIDSQVKEMLELAERENLDVVDIRRESHSAKDTGIRPVFNELLQDITQGKFNALLTWSCDRISRSGGEIGKVVDLMDKKLLLKIQTHSQMFSNNPNEKFLLMILGSQAKLENDNRGINVKRGLRARCELGLWPTCPPTGYLKSTLADKKGVCTLDQDRAPVIRQMYEKVAYEKWSGRKLYHWLKFDLNFRSGAGKKHLSLSNIYLILQNTFYYGSFEFPRNSGKWYEGKHEPIVTKELFDLVQEQIKRQTVTMRDNDIEFAFTKIMKCGLCGSGITATEKFKKLKNGGVNRHIYYGCTKVQDRSCKGGYINETDLTKQFLMILDTIDLDKTIVRLKFETELKKYNKFYKNVLGLQNLKIGYKEIDLKTYVKYILLEGTIEEKRGLVECFKSQLQITKKVVTIKGALS